MRALGPLLAAMRYTRGTSAVTYPMVTGPVVLVAAPTFQRFDTRTWTAIEDWSGLVAQLDGTEAQHADSRVARGVTLQVACGPRDAARVGEIARFAF
jgi:hypothetical protein